MTDSKDSRPEIPERVRRMSVGGRLTSRGRLQELPAAETLPLIVGGDDPPPLTRLLPAECRRVEIEVGCGKGAFLLAAATVQPGTFFLGIEAAGSYAQLAAAKLAEGGTRNAAVLIDNAVQYLQDRVDPHSVDRLHVYFPDPWPKRRHRGRRFFVEDCPRLVHRVLRPGGLLCVATDNAGYGGQIARVLGASPLLARDEVVEAELIALGAGHAFTPTNFERKYLAQGRIIRRWAFRALPVEQLSSELRA
ncbi:MAG: tRNA (guanosine(46)-N(7))-methyltransferase TrmB [Planctomycetota bacterium]